LEYFFVDVILKELPEHILAWEARNPKKVPGKTISFADAFPSISREQFEEAKKITSKAAFLVSKRNVAQSSQNRPSQIWEAINIFAYTLNPTYEVMNTWRFHTQLFTGHDIVPLVEARYQAIPRSLLKKYLLRTRHLPEEYFARPPRILGECGWEVNGGIVNEDVIMYQRHITSLYLHGLVASLRSLKEPTILEIGGGYGALAYFLKKLLPQVRYYMVDLPESLVFPAVYLKTVMPEHVSANFLYDGTQMPDPSRNDAFTLIPNFLLSEFDGKVTFDCIINTGSFGEMTRSQVEYYTDFIEKNLSKGGFLYEENQDTYVPVSRILGRNLVNVPFEGQQKLWAKNESILQMVGEVGKGVESTQPIFSRYRRRSAEWASRSVRKFPLVKSLLKRVIDH
jgi:hypothetical protein